MSRKATVLAVAFLALSFAQSLPFVAQAFAEPVKVEVAKNVDERLFLLRLLEGMYEQWPSDVQDPKQFAAAVADARFSAQRFQQYINDHNLGRDLSNLYGDYILSLDAYTNFLASIGKIEAQAVEQAGKDRFGSGFKAGFSGAATYDLARNGAGMESGDAAGAALVVGLVNLFVDQYDKGKEREGAKQQAVAQAAQQVTDRIMTSLGRAQNVSLELSQKHGWRRGEAGFENDVAEAKKIQEMISRADIGQLHRIAEAKIKLRPRDPFVRNFRNLNACQDKTMKASDILWYAKDSVDAASLIPEGPIYDDYRGICLAFGALMATEARSREINAGVSPLGSTELSRYAVSVWDVVKTYDEKDEGGEIREYRAWAYMADNRLNEAMAVANDVLKLRQNTPKFSYQYACLCSRIEDYDHAFDWLKQAISQGMTEIPLAKVDPDLSDLRRNRTAKFNDLVTTKWSWQIHWGTFNDDITLTNTSAFALTNVVWTPRIEQNDKVWTPELTAQIIQPGQTLKWENIVSIPGSRITNSSSTLTCDQSK